MLTFALISLVFGLHAALFGGYVADDAGISLAYARNLAAGHGPVLYPGGPAIEGYSNPLWVGILLVASALRLDGADGIPLLKAAGLALGAGALALTVLFSRVAYPKDDQRWVAPATLAVSTPFVFWSGAGLENGLYAFALTAAATLYVREVRDPSSRPWSSLALLAVAFTRPEGCAFFLAVLAHRLVAAPPRTRRDLGRLLAWAAVFVFGFSMFLVARLFVFGDWLPNTYYAKVTERHLADLLRYATDAEDDGRRYVLAFLRSTWPLAAIAAVGLLDLRQWRSGMLVAAIVIGTCAYALFVGGDFWPQARFFTAALPFMAVAAQHTVALVAKRSMRAGAAAGVALVLAVAAVSAAPARDLRRRYQEDTLISLQGRLQQGRKVRALADAAGIADPLYMDADIGGPTLAGLRVLDLGGLTDHHIARFHYYPPFFREYVFEEQRPHFIRTHASWTRTSRISDFPELERDYAAIDEKRDARGRHGLFVRRDLAGGAAPRPASPSFMQAVRAGRAVRAREDARERDGWITLYADRDQHAQLLRRFGEAGESLPRDAASLTELYFGLLAAGDRAGAARVAAAAGRTPAPITLHERSTPVLSVVDYRITRRPEDFASRLQLFIEVLSPPGADYAMWVHLYPGAGERRTLDARFTPGLNLRRAGDLIEVRKFLWVDPGRYDVRAGFWSLAAKQALCVDAGAARCEIALGAHDVAR